MVQHLTRCDAHKVKSLFVKKMPIAMNQDTTLSPISGMEGATSGTCNSTDPFTVSHPASLLPSHPPLQGARLGAMRTTPGWARH